MVRLGETAPELIQDFDPGLRTEAFLIAGLVDSGVDAARAVEMAGDALARNSAADRAERERRITEENHAAENRRFLVERWGGIEDGPTVSTQDLHAIFSEMVRASFLRTGDLGAAQQNAFNDFWGQRFRRYPARDPDGNPFDPDFHLPPGINDRPWQPDPEDAEPRPLPILPEDGPYGENKPFPQKPRWVWENGVWRQVTPDDSQSTGIPLADGGSGGGDGFELVGSGESGSSEGGGGERPGEGGGPAGGGEGAPGSEKESGRPDQALAQTEPGEGGEINRPGRADAETSGPPDGIDESSPPEPGSFEVPAWKKDMVGQDEMDRFMGHQGESEPNMRNALGETFAAEGGFKTDRQTGQAFAGITPEALEQIKKIKPSLKDVDDVNSMTDEQVAKAYRAYFDDALRRYGGTGALEGLKDPKTAAAFADTLFLHGQNRGAQIIKDATNEMIGNLAAKQRDRLGLTELTDQQGPKDTLDAMKRLTGAGLSRDLRKKIADVRKRQAENKRLDQRIDHFRF